MRSDRSGSGHPFECHEATDVVDEVLQSNLGSRSHDADRPHDRHRVRSPDLHRKNTPDEICDGKFYKSEVDYKADRAA